jgi:hypothetical protein
VEVTNTNLSDVADWYRNLTKGIKLGENENMSEYILKKVSYSLFHLT